MIAFEEAQRIIDATVRPLAAEAVPVSRAHRRILASDLSALYDSPPFANSGVDGYGRRVEDLESPTLRLAGEVAAGDAGVTPVGPGECVRIFTGAPIPPGIVSVAMQEDCDESNGVVRFRADSEPGDHVRRAGEDFRAGDVLLREGTLLTPAALGVAAGSGVRELECRKRPSVAILTSGDELIEAGDEPGPGSIFDSNSYALRAAVESLGLAASLVRAPDDREELHRRFTECLDADLVLTVGGVSVGDRDLLKDEFRASGIEERFWRVAIKPGKPIFYGERPGGPLVFGLPGNPVSALVTFFLFARPALLKLSGFGDPWPSSVGARFAGQIEKRPGRMEFLRGSLSQSEDGWTARSGEGQGSHQLSGLSQANCLIRVPAETTCLVDGDWVEAVPLRWGVE